MKYLKSFNESKIGDFFRKKFNEDEDIVLSIYKHLTDEVTISREPIENGHSNYYRFDIDGFKVEVLDCRGVSGWSHVMVDDVKMKCSENIRQKMVKKVKNIYEGYTKKDLRIHFKK